MLTQNRLKELLEYNPHSGEFIWKVSRGGILKGSIAGSLGKDSIRIKIDDNLYGAHRLAWLYVIGIFPSKLIDHINGNPYDNRFCNLREANGSQNQANKKVRKFGYKGVEKSGKKYRARIWPNGENYHLGTFNTEEEAARAYDRKAIELYGEFARTNFPRKEYMNETNKDTIDNASSSNSR